MLSKKAKYAIKALILLGRQPNNGPLTGAQIADAEKIPSKSLGGVLLNLTKAGYIYSKKGMNGGYILTRSPKEIFMVDIVRLIDGPIAMISCASAYHYRRCDDCPIEETCSIRDLYLEIRAADLKILSNTNIADMITKEETLANVNIESS